jgi:hypothetical protein
MHSERLNGLEVEPKIIFNCCGEIPMCGHAMELREMYPKDDESRCYETRPRFHRRVPLSEHTKEQMKLLQRHRMMKCRGKIPYVGEEDATEQIKVGMGE